MKQMTCAQLGGPCETKISANTPDEMLENGQEHLLSHPEMVEQMKKMNPDDKPKWMAEFMKKWESLPEVK